MEQTTKMTKEMVASTGIIRALADLPGNTIIPEPDLAKMLGKHPKSVQRAVERGELPVPVRFFGKPAWTAQSLRDHMNNRLEQARKEAEREARRISALLS